MCYLGFTMSVECPSGESGAWDNNAYTWSLPNVGRPAKQRPRDHHSAEEVGIGMFQISSLIRAHVLRYKSFYLDLRLMALEAVHIITCFFRNLDNIAGPRA